jgi:hypothetical protein
MDNVVALVAAFFTAVGAVGSFGSFIVHLSNYRKNHPREAAPAGHAPSGVLTQNPARQKAIIIGTLLLTVALTSLSFVLFRSGGSETQLDDSEAPSTAASVTARPIKISDPPQENPARKETRILPVCGTGDVPNGQHLWLFVYSEGSNEYFPQDRVEAENTNYWFINNVNLGAEGSDDHLGYFDLYTILADDSTSTLLDRDLSVRANDGYSEEEWRASFQRFEVGNNTRVQRDDNAQAVSRC